MLTKLVKLTAIFSVTISSIAFSGDMNDIQISDRHNSQTRDIHEFVAAQGTYCFDVFGTGECQFLNPPLANIFSWSDPASRRMGYFDYTGVADRAFNGRFGAQFEGRVREVELEDGRGLMKVKLRTKNAITWAYIRDPFNPFAQPEEQLFGHWITSEYSVEDGFVRGDSVYEVEFVIPEFGGPMPDLGELAFFPPPQTEIRASKFKGCAYDPVSEQYLMIHQESDEYGMFFVEDVLVQSMQQDDYDNHVQKSNKHQKFTCRKYLR